MTLLVAGILIGIGVPNVMEFQRNGTMAAAANDLVSAILLARTQAVSRQQPVTVCLSDNPTAATPTCSPGSVKDSSTRGYVVWVDENGNFDANGVRVLTDGTDRNGAIDANELVIQRTEAAGGSIRLSANCGYLSYLPTGFTRDIAGLCTATPRTYLFCDDRGRRRAAGQLSSARVVSVGQPGRSEMLQEEAAVNGAVTGALAGVNPTCPP